MKLTRRLITPVLAVSMLLCFVWFLSTSEAAGGYAQTFYDLDVIAVNGQNGLTSLFAGPSINDMGNVSFTGRTGGSSVFISKAPGAYTDLLPGGTVNPYAGSCQITNTNQIVIQETILGLNQQLLRIYDGNAVNSSVVVAGATPAFNDFNAIRPNAGINNNGLPVFSAVERITLRQLMVTGTRTTVFNLAQIPHTLKPMVADDGRVVVRNGNTGVSPIVLYNANLAASTVIASPPDFTLLGDSPGISDDGRIVVFFGDPAIVIDGSDEPGIFASVDEGGPARRLLRIAGRAAELGRDAGGNPIRFNPNSISAFNRVAVTHQELGPAGLDRDSFVVSFQAAPTAASPDFLFTGNNGLWTVRVDVSLQMGVFNYRFLGAMPVAQIGDVIGGRTVTDLFVYDPIANAASNTINGTPRALHRGENRVVFFATTNSADILVRATWFDSDEDGLPDHWETQGVNFHGQVIDLPAMGASPMHKDLFVHADWMAPNAGTVFQPRAVALKTVIDAFRRAPVANPDGRNGINIHIDAGANSIMNPATSARWGTRSKAGQVPHQPSIIPFAGGNYNFADLDNIKAIRFNNSRRAAIFHYALFADRYGLGDPTGGTSSGISRDIPASDFVVSLGAFVPAGGNRFQQAGTFIHELGHNLGLRHAGDDHVPNFKPNYLSVMNYSFQMSGVLRANGRGEYNYSTRLLPPLDENFLNEAVGISDPDNHRTAWFDQNVPPVRRVSGIGLALPAVDWFHNNVLNPGTVAVDINGNGGAETGANAMRGFNDWPALVFDGGGRIGSSVARGQAGVPGTPPVEASRDELENAVPPEVRQAMDCSVEEIVSVTPEGGGNAPLSVTFDASASTAPCGTIATYSWDFGDGNSGSGPIVVHVYPNPGEYVATLALTDNNGNINYVQLDYTIVVNPAATCSFSVSPSALFCQYTGGDNFAVNVTAPAGCHWDAVSNDTWIDSLSSSGGSGDGSVTFVVRENFTGGARVGSISIAGQYFTVVQNGAASCAYEISPVFANFTGSASTGSLTLTTSEQCAWQATTTVSWITFLSADIGIGSGTIDYAVAANPGPGTRKAKIIVGGQTLNVKQTFP